jgi:hypothetical protein
VRREGGLHPGDAAAGDQHSFFNLRGQIEFCLVFVADDRIESAAEVPRGVAFRKARVTAHALADFIVAPGAQLDRKIGVAEQLASQLHDVGLARGDDLLHEFGVWTARDGGNRRFDVLFDLRRRI